MGKPKNLGERRGPYRSRLNPYYEEIRLALEEEKSLRAILALLKETHGLTCSLGSLSSFIACRANPKRRPRPRLPKLPSSAKSSKSPALHPTSPAKGFSFQEGEKLRLT